MIASSARTSIRCDASKPTTPRDGATIAIFNIILIDAAGREERSTEWFAATVQVEKPDGNIYAVASSS